MSKMIHYTLNEEETKEFLKFDYGIDSKSGNETVGRTIIEVINSFEIKEDRLAFYAERVKAIAVKSIHNNRRVGTKVISGMADNYVHYLMLLSIKRFLFARENPEFREWLSR